MYKNALEFSKSYVGYVKRELIIVPIIPVLLVVLYGFALISSSSLVFRAICLSLMLWLVAYLAKATISTYALQLEKVEMESVVRELQELIGEMRKD